MFARSTFFVSSFILLTASLLAGCQTPAAIQAEGWMVTDSPRFSAARVLGHENFSGNYYSFRVTYPNSSSDDLSDVSIHRFDLWRCAEDEVIWTPISPIYSDETGVYVLLTVPDFVIFPDESGDFVEIEK